MSAVALESFLARLYTDEAARAAFLADARGEATAAGLLPEDVERLCAIDRAGLVLAAQSLLHKRAAKRAAARHQAM